jgi:hypothetical protein
MAFSADQLIQQNPGEDYEAYRRRALETYIGRPPTNDELKKAGDIGFVPFINQFQDMTQKIQKQAAIGGVDITPEEAAQLRDKFYDPNRLGEITDDLRAGLETYVTQRQQGKVKEDIDRAVNPGKYLDETKKAENLGTAQRLAQQFGQDDPDLVQFLSDRIAEGESAFELSQFLQTTPQYLKKQSDAENARVKEESAAARQALDQELLKSQQEVFERAQPSIISSYMRAGRLNSSGVNSALAKAQQDLERERQGFLANAAYNDSIRAQGYKREDFVGNNAQAFNQYLRQNEPAYQQRFNLQGVSNNLNYQQPFNNLNRYYSLNDQARARQYELEDYDRQQSDFNRYLSDSRKQSREAALYGLLGAGISGGIQGFMRR